jgi:hypothetical protein
MGIILVIGGWKRWDRQTGLLLNLLTMISDRMITKYGEISLIPTGEEMDCGLGLK